MPRIKLTVEYNGAGFHGWQVQPGLRTVQSELHKVLQTVLRTPIRCIDASGRTDAGVHARGQVVCVTLPELPEFTRLQRSVSALMKGELSVTRIELVGADFDPCRHATSKQYSYTMLNRDVPAVLDRGQVWHVPRRIDRQRLRAEAAQFIGTHDFSSFRGAGCEATTSVRQILESEISFEKEYIVYRVVGRGFLKQMVRNIVGTLIDLSSGKLRDTSVAQILEQRDRRCAGITAPPHGLCLDWVRYE